MSDMIMMGSGMPAQPVPQNEEYDNESKVSSCEITSSTKGVLTYKLKVYDEDPDKAVEMAIVQSERLRTYCDANSKRPTEK